MTYSAVKIANMALSRIGVMRWIDSLDENTSEAMAAKQWWEHCRDEVLAHFPWPFATKRMEPATLDVENSQWDLVYALPADALAINDVVAKGRSRSIREDQRLPWRLEHADGQRVLVCDYPDVEVVYTARIETVSLYPPEFVDALAWRLAKEFAACLVNSPKMVEYAEARYMMELARAGGSQAGQSKKDVDPRPDWLAGRG